MVSEEYPAYLPGLEPGSVLAGYRLEAKVGAGGMAVVYRARDERLRRLVALKVLAPELGGDTAFRRRFIAESLAAAAVDDPHIIPVYEAGEADGMLFIAMRFVVGGDLRLVLQREGALPPARTAEFISPVASALDAAHLAGLVHRDVKPGNILVDTRPGRPDHVYLSDFGISKGAITSLTMAGPLTGTGQFFGTPGYSAPEQIEALEVDGRADQYSLACVTFELLTGATPFQRHSVMAVLIAHVQDPPAPLTSRRPDLPAAVDAVMAKALAKTPAERYATCADFADALRDALWLPPYHARAPYPVTPGSSASEPRSPSEPASPIGSHAATEISSPSEPRSPTELPAPAVPRSPTEISAPVSGLSPTGTLPQAVAPAPVKRRTPAKARTPTVAVPSAPFTPAGQPPAAPADAPAAPADALAADDRVPTMTVTPVHPAESATPPAPDEAIMPSAMSVPTDAIAPAEVIVPAEGMTPPEAAPQTEADERDRTSTMLGIAPAETDVPPDAIDETWPTVETAQEAETGQEADASAEAAALAEVDETGEAGTDEAEADEAGDAVDGQDPATLAGSGSPIGEPGSSREVTATFIAAPPTETDQPTIAATGQDELADAAEPVGVVEPAKEAAAVPVIEPDMPGSRDSTEAAPEIAVPVTGPGREAVKTGKRQERDWRRRLPAIAAVSALAGAAAVVIPLILKSPAGSGHPEKSRGPSTSASATPSSSHQALAPQRYTPVLLQGLAVTGNPVGSLAFNPAGTMLAIAEPLRLCVSDLSTASCARVFTAMFAVAFSPDGMTLAGVQDERNSSNPSCGNPDGIVRLWNVGTGHEDASFCDTSGTTAVSGGALSVAFSPDHNVLAVGDGDGDTYLWNVRTGKPVTFVTRPGEIAVNEVAFSPDGTILAVGDMNGSTYLWRVNASTGTVTFITAVTGTRNTDMNTAGVTGLAFSHDGSMLAVGETAATTHLTYLWNASTWKPAAAPLSDPGGSKVTAVAFAPDGSTLAVGDGNGSLYLWNSGSGTLLNRLSDPDNSPLVAVAFSFNGAALATSDQAGNVYYWSKSLASITI